jgi:hypothetical protein
MALFTEFEKKENLTDPQKNLIYICNKFQQLGGKIKWFKEKPLRVEIEIQCNNLVFGTDPNNSLGITGLDLFSIHEKIFYPCENDSIEEYFKTILEYLDLQ